MVLSRCRQLDPTGDTERRCQGLFSWLRLSVADNSIRPGILKASAPMGRRSTGWVADNSIRPGILKDGIHQRLIDTLVELQTTRSDRGY